RAGTAAQTKLIAPSPVNASMAAPSKRCRAARSGQEGADPSPWGLECRLRSGREHLVHLVDEVTKVKRLGEYLGFLRRVGIRIKRHGREPSDKHNLNIGIEFGGAAGKLDPIHFRHYDIGKQE